MTEPGQEPFVPVELKTNWRPTCELRFLCINMGRFGTHHILQQKWITDDASQEEWRAVPSVTQKGE